MWRRPIALENRCHFKESITMHPLTEVELRTVWTWSRHSTDLDCGSLHNRLHNLISLIYCCLTDWTRVLAKMFDTHFQFLDPY